MARRYINENLNIQVSATFWPEIARNLSCGAWILCQNEKENTTVGIRS